MTVYLGSQNVGVGIVEKIPAEINNEDIIITENGVYTAEEGYTGFGSVTVEVEGSGNGKPIEALNATGKALNKGDKVWLNEDVRIGDTYFRLNSKSRTGAGIMSPSGLFGYSSGSTVSLVNDQSTIINSYSFPVGSSIEQVFYGKNQSVFIRNNYYTCRIDESAQYNLSQYTYFLGEDFVYNNTTTSFDQINISNGNILNSWVYSASLGQLATEMIKVGDSVYRFVGPSYAYRYKLEDDYSVTKEAITYTAPASESLSPVGVTADNKYVICGTSSYTYCDNNTASALRIVEIISPTEVKVLSQAEMPVELQPFYDSKSYYITFNPYNGILCVSGKGTNKYLIAQYVNGTFNKLPIVLPETFTRFAGGFMFSSDLSRICLGGYDYSYFAGPYVLNLKSQSGYAALNYSPNTTTQNTITGTTTGNVDDEGKIEVLVNGTINQDITITENGVYTADESFTGLGTITVNVEGTSSGGGDVIQAINNTGLMVNVDDRVWIKKDIDFGYAATLNVSDDALTGFAKTSVENGGFFDVNIILPKELTAFITVDVDDAYIGVE